MSVPGTVGAPTLELLAWVSAGRRTYGETMEAWRTSCPRLSVWEDALADGLVCVRSDGSRTLVGLTEAGQAVLEGGAHAAFAAG